MWKSLLSRDCGVPDLRMTMDDETKSRLLQLGATHFQKRHVGIVLSETVDLLFPPRCRSLVMFCFAPCILTVLSWFDLIFTTLHFASLLCVHLLGCIRAPPSILGDQYSTEIIPSSTLTEHALTNLTHPLRQTHVLSSLEGTPMPPPPMHSTYAFRFRFANFSNFGLQETR